MKGGLILALIRAGKSLPPSPPEPEPYLYKEWLQHADRAIAAGLNPNAIWRLHDKNVKPLHYDGDHDLGGEA